MSVLNPDFKDIVPSRALNIFIFVSTTIEFSLIFYDNYYEIFNTTSIYFPTIGSANIILILYFYLLPIYCVNIYFIIPATSISFFSTFYSRLLIDVSLKKCFGIFVYSGSR
jgi:hypothetical protein